MTIYDLFSYYYDKYQMSKNGRFVVVRKKHFYLLLIYFRYLIFYYYSDNIRFCHYLTIQININYPFIYIISWLSKMVA
jgi:hypothetical protein